MAPKALNQSKAGARPIFVVGASRSGTTLLARMLGQHPDLTYLRETQFFDDIYSVRRLGDTISIETAEKLALRLVSRAAVESVDREQFLSDARIFLDLPRLNAAKTYATTMNWLAVRSGKRTYIDQTPRNIYYLEELQTHFPDAFFICICRDARAVVASQKFRWRQRSLGANKISSWETFQLWANYHPYTACQLWNRAADCIMAADTIGRTSVVRYEDLTSDPEGSLAPVLLRAGYSFLPKMLEVPLWGSSHVVHRSSTGLSRKPSFRWRQVLMPAEQRIVLERCGSRMQALGYNGLSTSKPLRDIVYILTYPLHCVAVVALNPRRAWIQFRSLLRRPAENFHSDARY